MTDDRVSRELNLLAREAYEGEAFDAADLAPTWHEQFIAWFDAARRAELFEPNAMVLATADAAGIPSARTVLLRGLDARGFTFYTNLDSPKARELVANPNAALVFSWVVLHRQITVKGSVAPVSAAEAEAYWSSRPDESRISASVSHQSQVVASRAALERAWAELAAAPGELARPANWSGFRLEPALVEFWQGRRHRLHDRLRYRRERGEWVIERLWP